MKLQRTLFTLPLFALVIPAAQAEQQETPGITTREVPVIVRREGEAPTLVTRTVSTSSPQDGGLVTVATPFGAAVVPQGTVAPGQRGGARGAASPGPAANTGSAAAVSNNAWWTNSATIARLGLTDAQKARLENTFEAHRQNLGANSAALEKEEAQLARLLEAETIDRNAVFTQTNRVIQARGEMERTNALMTLEMREQLTRAQWMQLQSPTGQRAGNAAPQAPPPNRVGAGVAQANLQSSVAPVYPARAQAAQIQGVVVLQIVIDKEGKVANVTVVTGHPWLSDAAVDAVRQWRYRPILLNGQPIEVITTVTVNIPPPQ